MKVDDLVPGKVETMAIQIADEKENAADEEVKAVNRKDRWRQQGKQFCTKVIVLLDKPVGQTTQKLNRNLL